MSKNLHIATIIEIAGNGDIYPSIHHGATPEACCASVMRHLKVESEDRELSFGASEEAVLQAVRHGNQSSGPLDLRCDSRGFGFEFYLSTEVVSLQ